MTGGHRAPDDDGQGERHASDLDQVVRLRPGRPDPFRAPGVPERLVLVLHRDGLNYVGTISTWEYHAIDVTRRDGPGSHARVVREMIVDVSNPRSSRVVVRMTARPTAASLVGEVVETLRRMLPSLVGRGHDVRRRPAESDFDGSRHHEVQSPPAYSD